MKKNLMYGGKNCHPINMENVRLVIMIAYSCNEMKNITNVMVHVNIAYMNIIIGLYLKFPNKKIIDV